MQLKNKDLDTSQKKMKSKQLHEKVFNFTNYQRNANQNPVRYHFVPL